MFHCRSRTRYKGNMWTAVIICFLTNVQIYAISFADIYIVFECIWFFWLLYVFFVSFCFSVCLPPLLLLLPFLSFSYCKRIPSHSLLSRKRLLKNSVHSWLIGRMSQVIHTHGTVGSTGHHHRSGRPSSGSSSHRSNPRQPFPPPPASLTPKLFT
jgi:hypothetical protein